MKKEEADRKSCETKVHLKKKYYKLTLKDSTDLLVAGLLKIGKL